MLFRFTQIKTFIDPTNVGLAQYLPSASECIQIENLLRELEDFQSVTKKLQEDNITMSQVRVLFDGLIAEYQSCSHHLSSNATIIYSPVFEKGIIKIQQNEQSLLPLEEYAIACFKADVSPAEVGKQKLSFAEKTQQISITKTWIGSHRRPIKQNVFSAEQNWLFRTVGKAWPLYGLKV